jgi:hypothetical protein
MRGPERRAVTLRRQGSLGEAVSIGRPEPSEKGELTVTPYLVWGRAETRGLTAANRGGLAREGQAHVCRASRTACNRTIFARRHTFGAFRREPAPTDRMTTKKGLCRSARHDLTPRPNQIDNPFLLLSD